MVEIKAILLQSELHKLKFSRQLRVLQRLLVNILDLYLNNLLYCGLLLFSSLHKLTAITFHSTEQFASPTQSMFS